MHNEDHGPLYHFPFHGNCISSHPSNLRRLICKIFSIINRFFVLKILESFYLVAALANYNKSRQTINKKHKYANVCIVIDAIAIDWSCQPFFQWSFARKMIESIHAQCMTIQMMCAPLFCALGVHNLHPSIGNNFNRIMKISNMQTGKTAKCKSHSLFITSLAEDTKI